MEEFEIDITASQTNGAKIKAIGIGGGGGNMINHMIRDGIEGIDLIVVDTDAQALADSISPYKIQLGINSTIRLSAGVKTEIVPDATTEVFVSFKVIV